MKTNKSVILLSMLFVLVVISISFAGIRSDHGSSGDIKHIFYNVDPQTCITSGIYDCYVHSDWKGYLTIAVAGGILNTTLPFDCQPVILTIDKTLPNGGWDLATIGTSVQMGSQYYSGWGPDCQLVEGEMTEGSIYFPEQTIVYSEEYQGFIAYWLDQTP